MSDNEETPNKKKEAAVVSDASLLALAKEMCGQDKGLVFPMYLNIPTTQLVNMRLAGGAKGSSEEDMCLAMLQHWKIMRETVKDKEKVNDLERACRQMGQIDLADVILDRHSNQMELTEDCFPTA